MSAHPFGSELRDQLDNLERGMRLLWRFSATYQNLPAPWSCSPLGPTLFYSADASTALRAALGEDGWTFEHSHAWKEIAGIRIEVRIPQQTRPLTWREAQP